MAWNPNIPQPTDSLSQSQADILGNFQALDPLFSNGIQQLIDLPVQGSAPTFPAGDEGLYNLNNATTTKNELYVHRQTIDAPTDVPMTASVMSNTAVALCDNGWSYLPSGLLIKWGGAGISTATTTINFQTISGGPVYTRVFRSFLTPNDTGAAVNFTVGIRNPGTTSTIVVYANNPSGTTGLRYLILGV